MRGQGAHILKALGRAWAWKRRLESGAVATAGDLAALEGFTERFVSRTIRLAYLSPDVLDQMIITRAYVTPRISELIPLASTPWSQQRHSTFNT